MLNNIMKNLVVFAVVLCLRDSIFAQGQITFANSGSSPVTTNNIVLHTSGLAQLSSVTGIQIQLFYQPGSNPAPNPLWSGFENMGAWEAMQGSPLVTISPIPGRFIGGTETTGGDVAPNGNVWLTVVGWTGGYSSLNAALGGGAESIAGSAVWFQASGGGLPSTPATITGANQFNGLVFVYESPEPGTCVLLMCGAAVFGVKRWRKRDASSKFKV